MAQPIGCSLEDAIFRMAHHRVLGGCSARRWANCADQASSRTISLCAKARVKPRKSTMAKTASPHNTMLADSKWASAQPCIKLSVTTHTAQTPAASRTVASNRVDAAVDVATTGSRRDGLGTVGATDFILFSLRWSGCDQTVRMT
jgi:hypothetical protein